VFGIRVDTQARHFTGEPGQGSEATLMTCASAEELQARLALRALWAPAQASNSKHNADDSPPTTSTFHRHMRAEFDEVLKAGLSRRLGRLERKVNRLIEGSSGNNGQENISPKAATNGSSPTAAASLSVTEEAVQTTSSGSQDYWQEERKFGDHVPVEKLADAFEKAYLHAIRSTWPVQKKWGPSRRQNNYEDPPYKEEKLEKEMTTMRSTFSSLAQNLANRERQIISLKAQRDVAKAAVRDEEDKVSELEETLRQVSDPKKLPAVYESKRTLQKQDLEKLTVELQRTKAEAKQMQTLAKQQHAFFVQAETIFCQERGAERMRRFPAGERADSGKWISHHYQSELRAEQAEHGRVEDLVCHPEPPTGAGDHPSLQ